ncbi:hypothetical protein ON010_g3216 [Phytophthora cinnamomi]|nr:hypothetical protein ON010_g3216 [Phytophthora cinnamomi]
MATHEANAELAEAEDHASNPRPSSPAHFLGLQGFRACGTVEQAAARVRQDHAAALLQAQQLQQLRAPAQLLRLPQAQEGRDRHLHGGGREQELVGVLPREVHARPPGAYGPDPPQNVLGAGLPRPRGGRNAQAVGAESAGPGVGAHGPTLGPHGACQKPAAGQAGAHAFAPATRPQAHQDQRGPGLPGPGAHARTATSPAAAQHDAGLRAQDPEPADTRDVSDGVDRVLRNGLPAERLRTADAAVFRGHAQLRLSFGAS